MLWRLVLFCLLGFPVMAFADAVVFMYHRFGEDRYPSTSVRIDQFEAHLGHLKMHNYQVWPLERIVQYRKARRAIPDKVVAITIDDAYLSVYESAYPRLKALGWPFTVFVSTEPVDRRLKGFMNWDQMREMARNGARFANHGVTHSHLLKRLPGEDEAAWRARMRWELEEAQRRLEAELDVTERLFAYPYGEYDEALAALVRERDFVGFGQQSGPIGPRADLRALPRFPMAEPYADLAGFRQKLHTLEMPVLRAEPWDPLRRQRDRPRLELTLSSSLKRADEVRCYVSGQGLAEVAWLDESKTRLRVEARERLPLGRSRYNCTVPGPEGRYYWYSHPWLVMQE
ncbi:MAG: polysaccharide deacetylase family protein [Gammaproteobacteria bacterium]